MYPGVQTTRWTHIGTYDYKQRSYLRSLADKPRPLLCPLKKWKRDYLPTERAKKTVNAGYQQVLVKGRYKSKADRIHGMGIVMTLPKEWGGPPTFSTSTGKESDTYGLKKLE